MEGDDVASTSSEGQQDLFEEEDDKVKFTRAHRIKDQDKVLMLQNLYIGYPTSVSNGAREEGKRRWN